MINNTVFKTVIREILIYIGSFPRLLIVDNNGMKTGKYRNRPKFVNNCDCRIVLSLTGVLVVINVSFCFRIIVK